MPWRNLHQQRKEQERARINAAAMRELARRHRDEFEQLRREMSAPATGAENGSPEAPLSASVGAVGVPSHSSASVPSGGTACLPEDANGSTSPKANGAAVNGAVCETTTA